MDSAECSVEILRTMFESYLLKHSLLQSCFNVEVGKLLEPVVWLRPEKSSRPCSLDSARTVIEKPAIRLFLNYFPKMLQGCSYPTPSFTVYHSKFLFQAANNYCQVHLSKIDSEETMTLFRMKMFQRHFLQCTSRLVSRVVMV